MEEDRTHVEENQSLGGERSRRHDMQSLKKAYKGRETPGNGGEAITLKQERRFSVVQRKTLVCKGSLSSRQE